MIKISYITADCSEVHRELIMALNRQGNTAKIFFYSRKKSYLEFEDEKEYVCCPYNTVSRGPFLFNYKHKKIAKYIGKYIDTEKPEILHGNMLFGDGSVCRYISSKYKVPYVVSVRNTDMNGWFFWSIPWIRKMGIRNLNNASAVIFLSEPYKEELIKKLPSKYKKAVMQKSFVIPNGINSFWLNNKYDKERVLSRKVRFITVGSIEHNKNQINVATALELFTKKTGRDIEYVVVGKCHDGKFINKLCSYRFVHIKEYMKKEDLIYEYREADIYIMPSHRETFGLVFPEALSQGLPIVYSKGQGFDRQFDDGVVGVSVYSNDVEDICAGIVRVIDKYESMSKNALELCSCFNWDNVALELCNVYKSIV
jgi:glycosyltransferase involved in cell wall biosynthesis